MSWLLLKHRIRLWGVRHWMGQPWMVITFTNDRYSHPLNYTKPIVDYYWMRKRAVQVVGWYWQYGVVVFHFGSVVDLSREPFYAARAKAMEKAK